MFSNWMKLAMDTSMLAYESQQVVALRLLKLSRGGEAASVEAGKMLSEKAHAMHEAALTLAWGGTPGTVVRKYRRKVRANRRRLAGV